MPHHPHHLHHPHHPHGPHPHHERHAHDVFIRALRMMNEHGSLHSVKDLIVIAERVNEHKIAKILSGFNPDLRPDIAIDKLDVMLAEEAAHFREELLETVANRHIVLLGALPPHIHEIFAEFEGSVVLLPAGEHVPPHLRALESGRIIRNVPACRKSVSAAEVVICEVFRNTDYFASETVVDLVDSRIIRTDARVIAHLRPHKHHEDMPLDEAIARRIELY